MQNTKKKILSSVLALTLCLSMLVGSTFAWFTDSVSSTGNKIQSGNLEVDLQLLDKNGKWSSLKEDKDPIWDAESNKHWEPGYTDVKIFKVVNQGNLSLKWKAAFTSESELSILADVIDVYVKAWGVLTDDAADQSVAYPADRDLSGFTPVGTLRKFVNSIESTTYGSLEKGESAYLAIALKMQEGAGNDYKNKTIGSFDIHIVATQKMSESDSFGDDYDSLATFPGDFAASTTVNVENGEVKEPATVGEDDGINAEIPAGVKVTGDELTLTVETMAYSQANIKLENGETKTSLDIHVEGVAEDNDVPMLISLPGLLKKGLNSTSVSLYHVEDGVTVPMTLVANPTNHNEFSYDPATGDVVVATATFSEYTAVTDNWNLWEGTAKTDWYNTTDTEFTLTTAEQLAGLGVLVDGGNSFAGKTIKLGDDIDLKGTTSFNPIGCGYADSSINSNGVEGCVFMGTFDGQNHTISNLYQNGWELRLSYCNLGGGLFASVKDATIKNLTIAGAEIVMECVEQGIVAGLVQGTSTFANINIYNSSVANYQKATGGLIGEVSGSGTTTINNVVIGSDVVVGSLWGDFDAPVGGVIGARWDNENANPQIVMENVTVAARLDVYNDVTSTYQWYAYRRAGMLIGNTEQTAAKDGGGTVAAAPFLTCKNESVTVYYGDWTNYHYCEFNNHNPNWPWVRVEAGENCTAYSNPRYGVPNDPETGKPVTSIDHNHSGDDEHNVELTFNQLYGGGQGVYGQTTHEGVNVRNYAYSIQYFNDDKLLAETIVESNSSAFVLENDPNYTVAKESAEKWVTDQGYNVEFGGWVNAGSTKVTKIPAGNPETIKLYPYFNSPYTARFVDQQGNVLAWCLFHSEKTGDLESTRALAEKNLVFDEGFSLDHWEVHVTDENGNVTAKEEYSVDNFASYGTDVTVYPVYKFNGDVNLTPVDKDGDGDTDYYEVNGYGKDTGEQELVEIPGIVNGVPVEVINADAFSSYDDLHSVRIPGTITTINSQSFTADNPNQWGTQRDTVTIYYEGDPNVWNAAMEQYNKDDYSGMLKQNWDNAMGDGSRVFFLVDGKVDNTKYWELNDDWVWVLHEHAYSYEAAKNCAHGEDSHYEYEWRINDFSSKLREDKFTDYDGVCDCDSCNGATRPDAEYWITEAAE